MNKKAVQVISLLCFCLFPIRALSQCTDKMLNLGLSIGERNGTDEQWPSREFDFHLETPA